MTTSGIPSARKKLERALFHAEALRAAVDTFRIEEPYEFDMKSLGNPQGESDIRINVTVSQAPPVPDSWPLITGDILTNVHASLDHAIYPHVRETSPHVAPWRIQYPIVDTAGDLASKTPEWFTPEVRAVVENSQPYHYDDPGQHPLRILRELVNIDKHRRLVVANYYSIGDFEVEPSDLYELVSPPKVYKVPMVVGALVARVHLRLVCPVRGGWLMQLPSTVVYGETIEVPGIDGPAGLLQAVECVTTRIGSHLDDLEAAGC